MTDPLPPLVLSTTFNKTTSLPDMLRVTSDFAVALASPDARDGQGRTLASTPVNGGNRIADWRMEHVLNHRRVDPRLTLEHPVGEDADPLAADAIADAMRALDDDASRAAHRRVSALLAALAAVVGIARPPALHQRAYRNVRMRLPNRWQPLRILDGNDRSLLLPQAVARLEAVVPSLAEISYGERVIPGYKRRTQSVQVRSIVMGTEGIAIDDPLELMRRIAGAPVSPDDVIPLPEPTR